MRQSEHPRPALPPGILFFVAFLPFLVWTVVSCGNFPDSHEPDRPEAAEHTSSDDSYRIGKGDVLEIITWKEPDFSRDVLVRLDGKISFPLIADIQAASRTAEEVEEEIRVALEEYVTHPEVSVSIKDPRSRKYYLMGEVLKPGEYPLLKELSILQAFALAGGFTEWADTSEIVLIRRENGRETRQVIDYDEIVHDGALDRNLLLKSDDILVVP